MGHNFAAKNSEKEIIFKEVLTEVLTERSKDFGNIVKFVAVELNFLSCTLLDVV